MKQLIEKLLPATAALALTMGLAPTPATAQAPAGATLNKDSLVVPTLIADTAAVEAGKTFTVGVLFKMQPKWHIYWKNPGASGFATTVQWGLPDGASQSETVYPAPIMFESPGNLLTYGYDGETLLTTEVKLNNLPASGNVQIKAKAKWLMCSDRCIPGNKELTLTLPVGTAKPANAAAFDKYRKMVPKAAADLPAEVALQGKDTGAATAFTATITPPAGKALVAEDGEGKHSAYFFPANSDDFVIDPPKAQGTVKTAGSIKVYDGPVTLTWKSEASASDAKAPLKLIEGTLVYQTVSADGGTKDAPVLLDVKKSR